MTRSGKDFKTGVLIKHVPRIRTKMCRKKLLSKTEPHKASELSKGPADKTVQRNEGEKTPWKKSRTDAL